MTFLGILQEKPMSNRCIELHDSEITTISAMTDGTILVRFSSAYIHESHQVLGVDGGKGFVQEADLIVTEGKVAGNLPTTSRRYF
jgi:hypothetical protein